MIAVASLYSTHTIVTTNSNKRGYMKGQAMNQRENYGQARLLTGGMLLIALLALTAVTAAQPPRNNSSATGAVLYQQNCQVCHGTSGRGDGTAAYLLFPKPRDFTTRQFKIRSTPFGTPPTDEDLLRTITDGMAGSAMPGFAWLSEAERKALVSYVKQLAGIEGPLAEVISVSAQPALDDSLLAHGKFMYSEAGCVDCHGLTGRGDGGSAPTLVDDKGYPAPPNDFTRGIYKGGGTPADIYLRFTTGLSSTPMPSYHDVLEDYDRWALVHYVKSLAGEKVATQTSSGTIPMVRMKGELPDDPMDARWTKLSPTTLPMMLLWQRDQYSEAVSVRAAHNGKRAALLLEWPDDRVADGILRAQDFVDGAAVEFALSSDRLPHFAMGDSLGKLNLWQWRVDWQLDMQWYADVEQTYPALAVDDYPLQASPSVLAAALHTPTHGGLVLPAAKQAITYLSGTASGNPLSDLQKKSAVMELNAVGFGTLETQPAAGQHTTGRGVWARGKWRVVFVRDMKSTDADDINFAPGKRIPVAFAVWDGDRGDRNGQKAVTSWYFLEARK